MKKKHSCYLQISTYEKLIFSSIILENATMIWHRHVPANKTLYFTALVNYCWSNEIEKANEETSFVIEIYPLSRQQIWELDVLISSWGQTKKQFAFFVPGNVLFMNWNTAAYLDSVSLITGENAITFFQLRTGKNSVSCEHFQLIS